MADNAELTRSPRAGWTQLGRRARGAMVLVMGCIAMAAPFFAGPVAVFVVGFLLIVCGVLELLETFHS